jgi:hypothetical protein
MFALSFILIVLFWALLKWLKSNFKVFEKRGVKFEEPVIVVGNCYRAALGRENLFYTMHRLYEKFYGEK